MSVFEDVLEVAGEIRLAGKVAEATLKQPGDEMIVDIPEAQRINALLVKGRGGSRFRIDGFHVTREK